MGLFRAAKGAIGSTFQDQWKDAIRCDDMTDDMLMVRKTTPTGVITNGSVIVVAPGQCAIIYDNGRVIDASAEEGVYTFDTSSSPSFFAGQFKDTFKEMWERFTFNGETSKQQAVFFFNIKEIMNNKFGTATPIPFQDWSHPIPNRMTNTVSPMSVKIRCYGTYTFRMDNPAVFMSELAGTVDIYFKKNVEDQMRSEVMASFQNILNELGNSNHRVPVLEMPSQTDEIKEMMEQAVYDEAIRRRGLRLISFSVESVTLDDESEDKINNYEFSSNTYMQQGRMTEAYANAIENAAKNTAGVGNGFMGIGIANMSTGGMMSGNAANVMQDFNAQSSTQNYNPYAPQQPINQEQVATNSVQAPAEPTHTTSPVQSQASTKPETFQNTAPAQTPYEMANNPMQNNPTPYELANNPMQNNQTSYEAANNQIQNSQTQYENTNNSMQNNINQEQPATAPITEPVAPNPAPEPMQSNSVVEPVQESVMPETESTQVQNVETAQTPVAQTQEPIVPAENSAPVNENATTKSKLCLRCGNINPAGSLFCNKCGNQLQ